MPMCLNSSTLPPERSRETSYLMSMDPDRVRLRDRFNSRFVEEQAHLQCCGADAK
jgi:hypothetical protein